MDYFKLIEETLNYIDDHLSEDIRLDDLSKHNYISKYYLSRIFRALTQYSLTEYIDRRRLSDAAVLLKTTELSVMEIALHVGYNAHEILTRKFKKQYHLSPSAYRKSNEKVATFIKPVILRRPFIVKNNHLIVDYELIKLNELPLIGKRCNNGYDDEKDPDTVGNFLYPFANRCFMKNRQGHLYFVALDKDVESETLEYFVGFDEIKEFAVYDHMIIPSGDYAVFKYKGLFREHIPTIINDMYKSIALSDLSLRAIGIEFIEVYDAEYLETYDFQIYVPVNK